MNNQTCSIHNGAVLAVCLSNGCEQPFLCLKCYKGHPDHHEPFVKEVSDLIENKDWIKPYEDERDRLIEKQKDISSQKDKIFLESENLLQGLISHFIENLEKKKNSLHEELKKSIFYKGDEIQDDLSSKFDENFQNLQSLNFQEGDICEKVTRIREFNEGLLPETKKLVELTEERLRKCSLDGANVEAYKHEIFEIIESLRLDKLVAGSLFESLKGPIKALKEENERIKQALVRMSEAREALEENKKENVDLSQKLSHLKAENEEFTKASSQMQTQLEVLTRELEAIKDLNEHLAQDNKSLADQINSLVKEKPDSNVKIAPLDNQKNDLQMVVKMNNQPTSELPLWTWDPNKKSSKIRLGNNNLTAFKDNSQDDSRGAIGTLLMADGSFKWEIEVISGNPNKKWVAFGIMEEDRIKDFENFQYSEIIGMTTYGQFYNVNKVGFLSDYDNKIYSCDLDLGKGTFTISFQGVTICKETRSVKGKKFYPCILLFSKYNTAILKATK